MIPIDVEDAIAAVLYLWDAWSEAEGGWQPHISVFGTEDDEQMRADGFTVRRAPADVQATIRYVLSRKTK